MQRWAARLATAGFTLPAHELVRVNQALTEQSRVTLIVIVAFMSALRLTVLPELALGTIVALCGVGWAGTILFRRWLATGGALGLLVYVQFTLDVVLITCGLALVPTLPVLFHLQLLLIVIPCALL